MKQADKAQFWREQIESWSKSDVAQRRYCEDNNLSYSSFTYWRGKQAVSKTVASKLLPNKVTVSSSTISIMLPRKIRLEVAAGCLAEVLPSDASADAALSESNGSWKSRPSQGFSGSGTSEVWVRQSGRSDATHSASSESSTGVAEQTFFLESAN